MALRVAAAALAITVIASCGTQSGRSAPTLIPTSQSRVLWGMFQDHYPPNYSTISQTSSQLNHPTQAVHAYYSWQDNPNDRGAGNIRTFLSQTHSRGQIPLVTWEAFGQDESSIAAGATDSTIDAWARIMAAQKGEIWLRIFHEFNNPYDPSTRNGYPWSVAGGASSHTPDQLVAAWRHVYERFHAVGATNVKFVWTPDGGSMEDRVPLLQAAYPGDAYVDYTGWDTYDSYSSQSAYGILTQIAPTKPAVVAEFGATDAQQDFLTPFANAINGNQMPRVRAVVWFDEGKWSLGSNPQSAAALRTMLSGPAFHVSS